MLHNREDLKLKLIKDGTLLKEISFKKIFKKSKFLFYDIILGRFNPCLYDTDWFKKDVKIIYPKYSYSENDLNYYYKLNRIC